MNDKLKSCPFCGHEAKYEDGGFGHMRISCTNYDGCSKLMRVYSSDKDCFEKLANSWNTRSPSKDRELLIDLARYYMNTPRILAERNPNPSRDSPQYDLIMHSKDIMRIRKYLEENP